MLCSCFSGLDVEISRALEFTQSNNNQHHGIFICSHIISLKPLNRALCFSFESKCNYSKELSHKQQFKNLLFSLARGRQNMGCCNFIDNQLALDSHLLFATEKCSASFIDKKNEAADLQIKFQKSGLFSFTLKVQICRFSVLEQNIKLKTKQYLHITLIM